MGKLKTYQQQLQGIVDKGINAAEEQQKKISAKPFNFAEKLENDLRAYSVNTLRQRYYGYSDELFDQLRSLNSRFSNFAGDLVARIEREAAESADAISEAAEDVASEVSETAEDVASEVSDAAKDAKKSVEPNKPAARKTGARKTTSTAKKGTASA
jgi:methyl-accepting chemotaxis protein